MRDLLIYLNAIHTNYNHIAGILEEISSLEELLSYQGNLDAFPWPKTTRERLAYAYREFSYDRYMENLWKEGAQVVTLVDPKYPENLKQLAERPYLLYYKGNLSEVFSYGISIVGARKCTSYGRWATEHYAGQLSALGIPIISGLALGIDRIAHEQALEAGNATLAVLGTGIDMEYPSSNRGVYQAMRESNKACLVSEYPLHTRASKYTFPWRNRIISGLGQGVIVIEAKEQSGTLITARYGAEQGKEVFALPGNVNSLYSVGTNALIRDGARILTDMEDILLALPILKDLIQETSSKDAWEHLDKDKQALLEALKDLPKTPDQLMVDCQLSIQDVQFHLTELELNGYISSLGSKFSIK